MMPEQLRAPTWRGGRRVAAGGGLRDALAAARLAVTAVKRRQPAGSRQAPAEACSHIAPLYLVQDRLLSIAQEHACKAVRLALTWQASSMLSETAAATDSCPGLNKNRGPYVNCMERRE